jgi:glycosyltransferase involved in cell wall biosynthesis
VFPSVKEGWGLVALEALAAGLPVIATDIPVFQEYLTDGEGALMVPAGDASALAEAMRRVASDGDLRSRLAAGGPAVAGRYTWEACARRHAELYREVAGLR